MHAHADMTGTEAVIDSIDDSTVTIRIPGAAYRIELEVSADGPVIEAGQRVECFIEATALRLHVANGGGRFIEPIEGAPRIVAGHVRELDPSTGTFTLRSVMSMRLQVEDTSDLQNIQPGDLVNFHVRSGARLGIVAGN